MPTDIIKHFPRYPSGPVAKLGRLAVDVDFQGQKLGGALVWDAVMRA
jgi:predicted N-acetyltransferase YhbS